MTTYKYVTKQTAYE